MKNNTKKLNKNEKKIVKNNKNIVKYSLISLLMVPLIALSTRIIKKERQ